MVRSTKIVPSVSMLRRSGWSRYPLAVALSVAVAVVTLGFGASDASADEAIVGLWLITVSSNGAPIDYVFSGWTRDGLEFDQDATSGILAGYVCYGHWIKLKDDTYGLTHPFFDFNNNGLWTGTSGYFNYTVTVSKDGKTFTGKEIVVDGVSGPNPYAGPGTVKSIPFILSATKIEVDKSLLP